MIPQPPPDLPEHVVAGAPYNSLPPSNHETNLAMLIHLTGLLGQLFSGGMLGFVGPLIIWKTQNPPTAYIEFHAKEALNHQIVLALTIIILGLAAFVLTFVCIGFLLYFPLACLWVAAVIFEIIATVEASKGVWYRYPLNLSLIK